MEIALEDACNLQCYGSARLEFIVSREPDFPFQCEWIGYFKQGPIGPIALLAWTVSRETWAKATRKFQKIGLIPY